MPASNKSLSLFHRSLWQTLAVFILFGITFALYVRSEKAIDKANEQRFHSHLIAEELRQSSDDLTREVRNYVMTGNPLYKEHFQEILDIRNGIKPRPQEYSNVYWDLVGPHDERPRPYTTQSVSLLELMRKAEFTEAEFAKLSEAKKNSDLLALTEYEAIRLVESTRPATEANRHKASELLYSPAYDRAKYTIMKPIGEFNAMVSKRTTDAVRSSETAAAVMRIVFIAFGILLLFMIWRAYRAMHSVLGGSLSHIHSYITHLGSGDFSTPIDVKQEMKESVLGWLSETQIKLAHINAKRKEAEKNSHRQSQLYAALSQCNQAIVRSRSEEELFAKICEDAVTFGGMEMAWIGVIDRETKELRPVAYYGTGTDYLNGLKISIDENDPNGHGPSGTVCRDGEPFWCQDFLNTVSTAPWHARAEKFGWHASAAVPLHKDGVVIGTLNLYSSQRYAFDQAIQSLITEMTEDIDFALSGFARDKARRKAEDELKNAYNLLLTIINTAPVRIFWKDAELRYLGCNTVFAQDAGESDPRDVVGKSDYDLAWKEQAKLYRTDDRQVIDSKTPKLFFEEQQTTPEGKKIWLRTSKVPFYNENHETIGVLGVYEDITEQKTAENELIKLSQAIEQSSNTIIITDAGGNIEYVNSAFVSTTGYTQSEAIGKNPRFLQSGKTPYGIYDEMWDHITRGETWHGELTNRRKNGTEYIYSINISPVFDTDHNITHFIAIEEDITEQKENEEHIHYLANFDPLTGLPNRRQLNDRFEYTLALAKRGYKTFAVMFLDLDHFKEVNDSLGHGYGDALLIELARRLQSILREEDTISRLGGDEFILLLPDIDVQGATQVATKLQEIISLPFIIEQQELTVTASIGIALYPSDGTDRETLAKNADAAMYRAKQEGRNAYFLFTEEMQTMSIRNLQLNNALHHALLRDELHIKYQPQISLKTGHVIGAEALLRWEHPEFGMISPTEFIPIAENSGLILPIGEWVLRTAAAQLKRWIENGLTPIIIAVNLSAVQFRHPNLPDMVTKILDETALPPEYLELELTEGVAMNNPQGAISIMNHLHERGIRMSIDDFGTGYSSLSYLKQFKIYKLKIDQSFVRDINIDPEDRAIVGAIINMARSLGLHTIAEGVETIGQLEYLREQGCDEVQGYYYSKPLNADAFEAMCRNEDYLEPNMWSPTI